MEKTKGKSKKYLGAGKLLTLRMLLLRTGYPDHPASGKWRRESVRKLEKYSPHPIL